MLRTLKPFAAHMLFAITGPIFIVMTVAFITIPFALGGHPGEIRIPNAATATYHPS